MNYLFKEEPSNYSFDAFAKDKKTVWNGVANATALIHIRAMKKGDEAIIYHTGDEKSAVGLATITSAPYADPAEDNEKLVVVDLKVGKRLVRPVTLAEIKADKAFADLALVKMGRLSVVPATSAQWQRLLHLGSKPAR